MVRVILEAPHGAGKSFVANIIKNALTDMGYEVVLHSSVEEQPIPGNARGVGKVFIQERWMPRED